MVAGAAQCPDSLREGFLDAWSDLLEVWCNRDLAVITVIRISSTGREVQVCNSRIKSQGGEFEPERNANR